jgi:hypothetical protein
MTLSANRVVAASTWAASAAAAVAGLEGVFPTSTQNAIVVGAALLAKVAVAVKFMEGSQRWDKLLKDAEAVYMEYEHEKALTTLRQPTPSAPEPSPPAAPVALPQNVVPIVAPVAPTEVAGGTGA